jgi:phosphoglycerate transporter family protein
MMNFLNPPAFKPERPAQEVAKAYSALRWQVFIGIFIGYAGYYIVRKNFSMAIPSLAHFGFEKGELSIALAMNAVAYALSKFLMGSVSDRSNARIFLPLGLILASLTMAFMAVPLHFFGAENKMAVIVSFSVLNFLVGWFNGMGWPPCGRVMTHWFSVNERGTMMSIWNCAHNVGGALVGPLAVYGAAWFGSWFYGTHTEYYFQIGTYVLPAIVGLLIALVAYLFIRDTPQSCGLPSIEKYRNDYPKNYSESQERVLSTKEIFFKHVFNNRMLWYIAMANAFVYMVRYGCLDWAPTYLKEAQGYDIKQAGWAYFAYEIAAIPGTIVCGIISDKVFKGARAMTTIIFMALVALFILLYWQFSDNYVIVTLSLIAIGFFIYGPVMLIGVHALDLAPKNAAGTAAGLTGFFGYFFGTALLANVLIGYVAENAGWDWTFILLLGACALSILLMALTYGSERGMRKNNRVEVKN